MTREEVNDDDDKEKIDNDDNDKEEVDNNDDEEENRGQ